jgi:6-pyruvoyltetrahydropterin/6-carboxytetrahydropterin synthase
VKPTGITLRTSIGRHFDFESAHQLKGKMYGKCQNLHGHRYHLVVEVEGSVNQHGWVCDFAEIEKTVLGSIIDRFDHQNLNDFLDVPTVENIARLIFETLESKLKSKSYRLSKVLLYETADSYAEITR